MGNWASATILAWFAVFEVAGQDRPSLLPVVIWVPFEDEYSPDCQRVGLIASPLEADHVIGRPDDEFWPDNGLRFERYERKKV